METLTAQQRYILEIIKASNVALNPRTILSEVQRNSNTTLNPFPKSTMINDVRDTINDLDCLKLITFTSEGIKLI